MVFPSPSPTRSTHGRLLSSPMAVHQARPPAQDAGDAPPNQVAQAMERLGPAGRLFVDIRLHADHLLEALFVAGGVPLYSVHQHVDRMERVIVKEDAAIRFHFEDLHALGCMVFKFICSSCPYVVSERLPQARAA